MHLGGGARVVSASVSHPRDKVLGAAGTAVAGVEDALDLEELLAAVHLVGPGALSLRTLWWGGSGVAVGGGGRRGGGLRSAGGGRWAAGGGRRAEAGAWTFKLARPDWFSATVPLASGRIGGAGGITRQLSYSYLAGRLSTSLLLAVV